MAAAHRKTRDYLVTRFRRLSKGYQDLLKHELLTPIPKQPMLQYINHD
jgi:hypothetical protein